MPEGGEGGGAPAGAPRDDESQRGDEGTAKAPVPARSRRRAKPDPDKAQTALARQIVEDVAPGATPEERVPPDFRYDASSELGGGTRALSDLLTRSPFFDYFCRVAERSSDNKTPEKRVAQAKAKHWVLFRFCVALDMLLRTIVVLLLLAVIVAILYKTLSPLPGIGGTGSGTP